MADDPANQFPALREFQDRVRAIAREVDLERDKMSGVDSDDSDDDPRGTAAETAAEETLRRCLDEMARPICLFRREKTPEDARERKKFLKIVKTASRHLLMLYYEPPQANDTPLNLTSHPSNGVKKLADSVHDLLGQHWKCECNWRPPTGVREARLSLTRHRHFLLKVAEPPQPTLAGRGHSRAANTNAKFEVLLPVCKNCVAWKVTNVHAMARM